VSERTCLYCGEPLEGVRRDALVHPHHAREWRRLPLAERRRRKGDATARVTPERPPEPGKGQAAALLVQFMPWPCPDCGGTSSRCGCMSGWWWAGMPRVGRSRLGRGRC
jgi:hypothetical protein